MASLEMSLLEQPTYIDAVLEYLSRSNYAPYRNFALEARKDPTNAYIDYLKNILLLNISDVGSPYWRGRGISSERIKKTETLSDLLKIVGEGDTTLLEREDGFVKAYMPKGVRLDDLYSSSSSGTTGNPKTIYHSLVPLTTSALNEAFGIKEQIGYDEIRRLEGTKLLALGPKGAYQKELEELAKMFKMEYVNLGFNTAGLKKLSPEEMMMRISPVVARANEELQKGGIGLLTASKEAIPWLGDLKRVKIVKLSGTGIDFKTIRRYEETYPEVYFIPSYGHYAAMSSIGIIRNSKIVYFPSWPFSYFPVHDGYDFVRYSRKGDILMILAHPEFLLIKRDDRGIRERPQNPFSFDGVSDISR